MVDVRPILNLINNKLKCIQEIEMLYLKQLLKTWSTTLPHSVFEFAPLPNHT